MNLYLISQKYKTGYDTYDSAVVVAESEEAARKIYPGTGDDIEEADFYGNYSHCWCMPEHVEVKYLGKAESTIQEVVCASFNAG